jgi:hypothetical protein
MESGSFWGWIREEIRRARLPGQRASCLFGGAGCQQITVGNGSPHRCGNCDNGRPQFYSGYQLELMRQRHDRDLAEGWIKEDGSPCDREVFAQAIGRRVTPAVILAERLAAKDGA